MDILESYSTNIKERLICHHNPLLFTLYKGQVEVNLTPLCLIHNKYMGEVGMSPWSLTQNKGEEEVKLPLCLINNKYKGEVKVTILFFNLNKCEVAVKLTPLCLSPNRYEG
jgi:hypothetical protein